MYLPEWDGGDQQHDGLMSDGGYASTSRGPGSNPSAHSVRSYVFDNPAPSRDIVLMVGNRGDAVPTGATAIPDEILTKAIRVFINQYAERRYALLPQDGHHFFSDALLAELDAAGQDIADVYTGRGPGRRTFVLQGPLAEEFINRIKNGGAL